MRNYIPVFAPDFGDEERTAIHQHIATDQFITAGKHVTRFEQEFGRHIGRQHCLMTNSGSSALLAAIAAMRWNRGDKVLTPAVTFPTTISPLLLMGVTPVFVDVEEGTYNIDPHMAVGFLQHDAEYDIAGAIIPHTLGNPVDPAIWECPGRTIEDACDAFDSEIDGRKCGTFGAVSTFSFYPAHHMTTGEGGMVCTENSELQKTLTKIINWGRACWCKPGFDDSCGKRFHGEYDHKYTFDEPGFNLKPLDLCGVLGSVQLAKADRFKQIRRRNFEILDRALAQIDELIVRPRSLPAAVPNWFGYPITLRRGNRNDITRRIEARGVATRLVFGGNITKQPMFKGRKIIAPCGLEQSDRVMRDAFIVGINQTITEEEANHIAQVVKEEITR